MPDETSGHVNFECVAATFRPCQPHAVRRLDGEADYPLARDFCTFPLSPEDWLNFHDEGYQYCAVIE